MNNEIKVLDHGLIRLVDHMGGDLNIARSARVSYDAAWRAGEDQGSDERLINYLYSNGHNTPFESVQVMIEVKAPIFVFRQWHRHRTQSYNELSARYRELPEVFYVPELEQITLQSEDNKQMRTVEQHPQAENIQHLIKYQNRAAFSTYRSMIDLKAPRELARSVLPVGTYSHMFANANLGNWFKFLSERLHEHAQYEIRVYAIELFTILKTIAPVACGAFEKRHEHLF